MKTLDTTVSASNSDMKYFRFNLDYSPIINRELEFALTGSRNQEYSAFFKEMCSRANPIAPEDGILFFVLSTFLLFEK